MWKALLLFLFCTENAFGCLKVQWVVPPTTMGPCFCNATFSKSAAPLLYVSYTGRGVELVNEGNFFFYTVEHTESVGGCKMQLSCKNESQQLAVYGTSKSTVFTQKAAMAGIEATCQADNTWSLPDGENESAGPIVLDQLMPYCVISRGRNCLCTTNYIQSISDFDVSAFMHLPLVKNASQYKMQKVQLLSWICGQGVRCLHGDLLIFDETRAILVNEKEDDAWDAMGACNVYTETWDIVTLNAKTVPEYFPRHVNMVCVDFSKPVPCFCNATFRESIAPLIFLPRTGFWVISMFEGDYRIAEHTESVGGCKMHLSCKNASEQLIVVDTSNEYIKYSATTSTAGIEATCLSNNTWSLPAAGGKTGPFNQLMPYCVAPGKRKCSCSATQILNDFDVSRFMHLPLVRNASQYSMWYVTGGAWNCGQTMSCLPSNGLIIFDETKAILVSPEEGSDILAGGVCDMQTDTWDIVTRDSNYVPEYFSSHIYIACVDFSKPAPCSCPATGLNKNNIQTLLPNHPFLNNITSYTFANAQMTADGSDGCSKIFECPAGQRLVILDKTEAYLFAEQASVFGICDPYGRQWILDDSQTETIFINEVFAACVTFPAPATTAKPLVTTPAGPCICDPLPGINEINRVEYDPNEQLNGWIAPYTMKNDTSGDAGVCYQSTIECANDLYVFNGNDWGLFNVNPAQITCKRNSSGVAQWSFAGHFLTNAVFGCVKPEPALSPCYCPVLHAMSDYTRETYDPNGEMVGGIVDVLADGLGFYVGHTLCFKAVLSCEHTLYLYNSNSTHYAFKIDGSTVNNKVPLRCMKPPGGDAYQWFYGTTFIWKPAYACIKP